MFEKATREQYRFESTAGLLTPEDLWQLPLKHSRKVSLNDIAQSLYQRVKVTGELPDFVLNAVDPKIQELQDKLELVKYVIEVLKEEAIVARQARISRNQKELLTEILHEKKNDELKALSVEDLEKRLAEM